MKCWLFASVGVTLLSFHWLSCQLNKYIKKQSKCKTVQACQLIFNEQYAVCKEENGITDGIVLGRFLIS